MGVEYSDDIIKVARRFDRRIGKRITEVAEKDAAVVLFLPEKGKILMERHYRPVLGKTLYELPAGFVDPRESPRNAAIRELKEETGYVAKTMRLMFQSYASPGILSSKSYTFLAAGVKGTGRRTDPGEKLTYKIMDLEKAIKLIKLNKVLDKKTIAAVLYYAYFMR